MVQENVIQLFYRSHIHSLHEFNQRFKTYFFKEEIHRKIITSNTILNKIREHYFIKEIIKKEIQKFIENHILQYSKELEAKPLCFVGSIACHSKEYITKELVKYGLKPSSFVRIPIHILKTN